MPKGSLTGEIQRLKQSVGQISEGVVQDAEIVGQHIEVEVALAPSEQTVWVELLEGLGGAQGGAVRVPSEGDSVLVGLVDGDPNAGFMLGWLSDTSTPLPPQVQSGTTYIWAPANEPLKILTAQGEPALTLKPTGEVVVEADTIRLGSETAVQDLALAEKVESEISDLKTKLLGHTHSAPSGATGPPQPSGAVKFSDVGSETVKADG